MRITLNDGESLDVSLYVATAPDAVGSVTSIRMYIKSYDAQVLVGLTPEEAQAIAYGLIAIARTETV